MGASDIDSSNILIPYKLPEQLVLQLLPQEEERIHRFADELKAWLFGVRVGPQEEPAAREKDSPGVLTGTEALLHAAYGPQWNDVRQGGKMLIVSAVPMLFGIPLSVRDMRLYLQELCDRGGQCGSGPSFRPSFVTRILNSLACKNLQSNLA